MPVTVIEQKGQDRDGQEGSRRYRVEGATTVGEAMTAVLAAAPTTWDGMLRSDIKARVSDNAPSVGIYDVSVPYQTFMPIIGGSVRLSRISIDFSPQSVTKYASDVIGGVKQWVVHPASAPDYEGLIGVDPDGTVNGTEIEASDMSFEIDYELHSSAVNQTLLTTIYTLSHPSHVNENVLQMNIGTVAAPNFIVFPARSVRFRGMRLQENDAGNYAASAFFHAAAPFEQVFRYFDTVGIFGMNSVTVTGDGHDRLWFTPMPKESTSGGASTLLSVIKSIHAHRVYPAGNLATLNIPAA